MRASMRPCRSSIGKGTSKRPQRLRHRRGPCARAARGDEGVTSLGECNPGHRRANQARYCSSGLGQSVAFVARFIARSAKPQLNSCLLVQGCSHDRGYDENPSAGDHRRDDCTRSRKRARGIEQRLQDWPSRMVRFRYPAPRSGEPKIREKGWLKLQDRWCFQQESAGQRMTTPLTRGNLTPATILKQRGKYSRKL
jgi:hypothetical protein